METALGGLGVEAIVVGGCCELNTTAHGLIIDIGTQLGIRAATAPGEDVNQCVALETTHGVQTPTNHPGAVAPAPPNGQTNHTHPAYG